jgi:hypothetical protein
MQKYSHYQEKNKKLLGRYRKAVLPKNKILILRFKKKVEQGS